MNVTPNALGICVEVLGAALLAAASAYAAEAFPARPVTIIVPHAPGGTGEVLGRLVGNEMQKFLRGKVIVEERLAQLSVEPIPYRAAEFGRCFLTASTQDLTPYARCPAAYDVLRRRSDRKTVLPRRRDLRIIAEISLAARASQK